MTTLRQMTELISSGHKACPGCGGILVVRHVLRIIGSKTIITVPASCLTVMEGEYPRSAFKLPFFHTTIETAAAVAAGIRAGLRAKQQNDIHVVAFAGDGGTYDIGLQALSGAAERNEDILYVCYDNEAYMNTGLQRSSSTPYGASTSTTSSDNFKTQQKKDIIQIMLAHNIPYAATICVSYLDDLKMKVKKASSIEGTRFLLALAPCPPGWGYSSDRTIELGRLAVRSRVFPLLEAEHGKIRVTKKPAKIPVSKYLLIQNRFRHLTDHEIARIQENVDQKWRNIFKAG